MSSNSHHSRILLIPSAGMGHLIPFVRLANLLSARGITVSLLAARPTISASETRLLSSLPSSLLLNFPLTPLDPSLFPPSSDPFLLRMETLRLSSHLLPPLISSSTPPISSLILDISISSTFLPIAASLDIPSFIFFTSSASMLAFSAIFPSSNPNINIPNTLNIPPSYFPTPLHNPTHFFTTQFIQNGKSLTLPNGILINTFPALESKILHALNSHKVVTNLAPVIAIGPLTATEKVESEVSNSMRNWLDSQREKSVVYVSFGSRTGMSKEQIRELGAGLEMSGVRFLWVMKSKIVDREERGEVGELVGEGFVGRLEGRGLVVREWVEQEVVLRHKAVGGFLSHCGWNSIIEAAAAGVRVLAWPRMGDQRVNAGVVEESGIGIWPEEWVWEAEDGVVAAEEIAKKLKELMEDERVGEKVKFVANQAAEAVREGGSLENELALFERKVGL